MIRSVHAAQRLDSWGRPTIRVDVTAAKGTFRALVPSGASTGSTEAVELRDEVPSVYGGRGVEVAVKNVVEILGPGLIEKQFDPCSQLKDIDAFMCALDGTKNKARLGANAILGVSMACARAGAAGAGVSLYDFFRKEAGLPESDVVIPVPFFNVLNGGAHSGNDMAFQEFMIAPVGAANMKEAIRMGAETYYQLQAVIERKFGKSGVAIGDEGGFAPPIHHPEEALELLTAAVNQAGYTGKIKFGIDPASSEFYRDGSYDIGFKRDEALNLVSSELAGLYDDLISRYPVVLLEDPFAEEDWSSWTEFNKTCQIELVGDDLLTTNVERIQIAKREGACNSMLLKVNQIGTVSEAIEANNVCTRLGWNVFVSHRSGETTDDLIADLTVGLRAGHLKAGAPARGERVAKYNRLMDIEDELAAKKVSCVYAESCFNSLEMLGKC
ncbi:Enolase, C-terminal TIM barrel domain-containing protein [Xylaria scruposa]|nr:Enolase, C-terminal TIM barrel domain-containing protein [Xylaria scruposa]